MYHDRSTCTYYDHSTCIYYISKCMYYDHNKLSARTFLFIFGVNCPRERITYCRNQRNAKLEKSGLLEETRTGQLGETRPGQLDETRAGLGMTEISLNLVSANVVIFSSLRQQSEKNTAQIPAQSLIQNS